MPIDRRSTGVGGRAARLGWAAGLAIAATAGCKSAGPEVPRGPAFPVGGPAAPLQFGSEANPVSPYGVGTVDTSNSPTSPYGTLPSAPAAANRGPTAAAEPAPAAPYGTLPAPGPYAGPAPAGPPPAMAPAPAPTAPAGLPDGLPPMQAIPRG